MKKTIALCLAALMLFACAGLAETTDEEFGYAFDDEGYTGEWTSLEGLGLQFCLPDGWAQLENELGAACSAVSSDGTVNLDVRLEAENVDQLDAWADANLPGWERADAGLYDAAVLETGEQLSVYFTDGSMRVICFCFNRVDPSALSRAFALQIAGSTSEDWDQEMEYFDDALDGGEVLAG